MLTVGVMRHSALLILLLMSAALQYVPAAMAEVLLGLYKLGKAHAQRVTRFIT